MDTHARERWSSQLGFTLAAVGSAVGLGNMWRFSYMAAENGGAAFVVLYVLMTAVVGLPVMLAELTIGRGAARSPIQALVHYGGAAWRPLGGLFVLSGFVILGYYSVISGWTVRYAVEALFQGFPTDAGAAFGEISEGWDAAAWHLGFMVATTIVVAGGIRGGIERAALVLMPVLGLLVIGLAIYASTLEGAGAGYAYYLQTDFAEILSFDVAKDAAGQAFFSLSLGMGAILTYSSYLERDHDLPREAILVAVVGLRRGLRRRARRVPADLRVGTPVRRRRQHAGRAVHHLAEGVLEHGRRWDLRGAPVLRRAGRRRVDLGHLVAGGRRGLGDRRPRLGAASRGHRVRRGDRRPRSAGRALDRAPRPDGPGRRQPAPGPRRGSCSRCSSATRWTTRKPKPEPAVRARPPWRRGAGCCAPWCPRSSRWSSSSRPATRGPSWPRWSAARSAAPTRAEATRRRLGPGSGR